MGGAVILRELEVEEMTWSPVAGVLVVKALLLLLLMLQWYG